MQSPNRSYRQDEHYERTIYQSIYIPDCSSFRDQVGDSMIPSTEFLLKQVRNGDENAMDKLLSQHRGRLRKMIRVRLHPGIRKRVDESDVLQEALLNASMRMNDYFSKSSQPFFLWLRAITSQVIQQFHRFHIDAQKRSVKLDHVHALNGDSLSHSMAHVIVSGDRCPADAVELQELQDRVRSMLDSLSVNDREVLCMRHFEGMSNVEVAESLEISTSNASTRYVRALTKLKDSLKEAPGFF